MESIRFWLRVVDMPIVFVENSDTDLSEFFIEEIAADKLEMLTFSGNNFDKELGKGFGELNCIEYGCSNSVFVSKSTFVFKVTGRYKVINFQTFLRKYNSESNINLLLDFKWRLSFVDSRFFGFTPSFIKEFLAAQRSVLNDSEGVYLEHVLAKAALKAIAEGYIFEPLPTLPRIEGYSASSGVKYNSNYMHWLRYKYEYIIKYRSFSLGNLPWI